MEVIRKFIDANSLMSIMALPEAFRNRKLEIIVLPTEQEIRNALNLTWADFEDSVQYSVALLNEMDGIVARNPDNCQEANMRIWLPEQTLELFAVNEP